MSERLYDAIVIGAGFSGIYQLHTLLQQGLSVQLLEKGSGPGGTWYWNRYPGAMSDTQSHIYRYSWDKEDLLHYPWSETYLVSQEVRRYLEHVVDRWDLRKHMQFDTTLLSADWVESESMWKIKTSAGEWNVRYLITALGLFIEPNWPEIPKRNIFKGQLVHTSRWPEGLDLQGKSVGVIGNGSTGVQLITTIAKDVGSLVSFQRHPQYSVPAEKRPVSAKERNEINSNWEKLWDKVNSSFGGMDFKESKTPALSLSKEQREKVLQMAWDQGGGPRFLLQTFSDILTDEKANTIVCDFIKNKISTIVKDPVKRQKLTPTELYTRRPLCDTGYYDQFNRPNVDVVDISANGIAEFTSNGLKLQDGAVHELDILICATGYDAFDGAYNSIDIRGRHGVTLREKWKNGASTNMGVAVSGFPNLLMVLGPKSPLSNAPPMIEAHVEFITSAIVRAETLRKQNGRLVPPVIESREEGDREWGELCNAVSDKLLFKKSDSYYFGANVPGKPREVLIFFGGLETFRQRLKQCEEDGYQSFYSF